MRFYNNIIILVLFFGWIFLKTRMFIYFFIIYIFLLVYLLVCISHSYMYQYHCLYIFENDFLKGNLFCSLYLFRFYLVKPEHFVKESDWIYHNW